MGLGTAIATWFGIGVMIGLGALLLPFQRGARGTLLRIAVAIAGAIAGGYLSVLLGPGRANAQISSMNYAFAGGVVAVFAYWFAWRARYRSAHHQIR